PHRLMLGSDDQRPLWNLLDAAKLHLDAADHPHQQDVGLRPPAADLQHRRARHQEGRQRNQRPEQEKHIEQDVENERTQENHSHLKSWYPGSDIRIVAANSPTNVRTTGRWQILNPARFWL